MTGHLIGVPTGGILVDGGRLRRNLSARTVCKVVSPRIITLLTDFGTEDYFVGAMKGIILTRSPAAIIVDITHAIPPQDVRAGAFTLSAVYDSFPLGSIHLAVVDPGVGSNRRPVIVEAAGHLFVGPDNGLFSMVLDRVPSAKVRHVTNTDYFLPNPSSTFHGRDIFAPVAAALAQGVSPEGFGPVIPDPVRFGFVECESLMDGTKLGRVIHIDHFGNCVTNFAWEQLQPIFTTRPFGLRVREHDIRKLLRTYSEVTALTGEPFVIVGSAGFLEISIHRSSAARELKITVGDPVRLTVAGS
jgi:S-adenosyl-L-methionine hydrolase (adenosine-forming)